MRSYRRASNLLESEGGRRDGWHIELDGRVVGALDDPQWVQMFWYTYAVKGDLLAAGSPLRNNDLWARCRFVFRSRRTGDAPHAFCGGRPPFIREGRVLMRGLYLVPKTVRERFWTRMIWLVRLVGRAGRSSAG
jgi:hypothetical protein